MKTNEKVLAIFMDKVGKVNEQLATLQDYADNLMDTDSEKVNWGDVGTADKAIADLNNLMAFLGLKTS